MDTLRYHNRGIQKSLWASMAAGMFGLILLTIFMSGPEVERWVAPVNTNWTATEVRAAGRDLIIAGTVVKQRNCEYIPPPIARAENGQNLYVESISPTATVSWPASDVPQKFGPWIVRDGAGRALKFYQRHDCHALWTTFTYLGEVDAREIK